MLKFLLTYLLKTDIMMLQERKNALLKEANRIYDRLPVYLQFAVDEDEFSGLESDEIPDGYDRLK
jgi:hypothetical protein